MKRWLQSLAETFGLREPSDTPPATPSVKTAVLAIDDDSEFLQTIRDLLRTHGLDVYIAASGPKGLNILASAPENLRVLLLDYKMPQFDGMDTLRYVHQIRRNVKVIAVTAIPLNQLPEEFRRGVDKLIFKPFQTTDLLAAIEEFTSPLPSAPDALSGARVP